MNIQSLIIPPEGIGVEFIDEDDIFHTKEELEAHIKQNMEQNQTSNNYDNTCQQCKKFQKKGPNMGYCRYNGTLVLKYNSPCEAYICLPKKQ